DAQLKRSLGWVTSAQYLGQAIGPAIGAVAVIWLGYRGMFLTSALIMVASAITVIYLVPNDRVRQPAKKGAVRKALEHEPFRLTSQLCLLLLLQFVLTATASLTRASVPFELQAIVGSDVTGAAGAAGLAFTLGGIGSVVGVFLLARFFRVGRLRSSL